MANNELDDIIREFTPRLRRYVRSRVGNNEDADDIVQDIFYQLMRTLNVLNNPVGHVASWLFTVARNLTINHSKKNFEDTLDEASYDEMDDSDPDSELLRKMLWEELDKALEELPPEQRNAFVMTEIDGLSTQEAAARMGVSQNTFLSRKHYAVKYIRKKLSAIYNEIIKE